MSSSLIQAVDVDGAASPELKAVIRKVAWKIIPLLAFGYLVNFLDRTSVAFAALQMNQDIGLTAGQFGLGAGMLFLSYCVLEVPSNVLMYRFGARVWLARIMITWGLAAMLTALAVGPRSFYLLRFLLGAFEAGFFPGVIWYLSIWFPPRYRTRALAWFIAAAPLSQLIGGPISVSLLSMNGVFGLAGWQWMFVLEGLPAVALGIACLYLLADRPDTARWLNPAERALLAAELAAEVHDRPKKDVLAALRDKRVILSSCITFCYSVGSYGLSLWLPLILKTHDLTTFAIGWLSAVPFLFATVATLVFAWVADRSGQKAYTLIFALALGVIGMTASLYFRSLGLALFWITIGLIGTNSARTVFFAIPQLFLSGVAAAGGLAFINAVGAFGGFVGPSMVGWLRQETGSFDAGLAGMAAFLVLAIVIATILKRLVRNA